MKNDPPYQFYCAYKDLEEGLRQADAAADPARMGHGDDGHAGDGHIRVQHRPICRGHLLHLVLDHRRPPRRDVPDVPGGCSRMTASGWGRIVNIAARSGVVGASKASHYAAAKAGIIGLTVSLAKATGPSGTPCQRRCAGQDPHPEGRAPSILDQSAAALLVRPRPARRNARRPCLARRVAGNPARTRSCRARRSR